MSTFTSAVKASKNVNNVICLMLDMLKSATKTFKDPDKVIYAMLVILLCFVATGAFAQSGNVYSERGVQTSSPVTIATVLQVREVRQEAQQATRYGGMAAGATLGSAVGVAMGRNAGYSAQTSLGLLGGILGGMGGQAVAYRVGGTVAFEYIVQTVASGYNQSRVIAITQPEPGPNVYAGEQVYLIQTNGTWRVIKANTNNVAYISNQ